MRVVLVHYHLRPGGVTGVIRSIISALAPRGYQFAIITGEKPQRPPPYGTPVCVMEELGYGKKDLSLGAEGFAKELIHRAKGMLRSFDLFHIHNHSLGKNATLPWATKGLALLGVPLLLQIHDFAEDFRPENYNLLKECFGKEDLGEILYPTGNHVHYAVLNERDRRFLKEAGFPKENLHLLPNTVAWESEFSGEEGKNKDFFLYPTRAIRRKNIGEFLLWASLKRQEARFATTLAPKNPLARPVYERWVSVAKELRLPVEFEIGERSSKPYPQLLQSAGSLITTSVAEGFGLTFLEPWLVRRPLVGRDLPEVTETITSFGIQLKGLYEKLLVPVCWVGEEAVRETLESGLRKVYEAYELALTEEALKEVLGHSIWGDRIEFSKLCEGLQEKVIRFLAENPRERQAVEPCDLRPESYDELTFKKNQEITRRAFGLDSYRERLEGIYQKVIQSRPAKLPEPSSERLLKLFLSHDRFTPLRTT